MRKPKEYRTRNKKFRMVKLFLVPTCFRATRALRSKKILRVQRTVCHRHRGSFREAVADTGSPGQPACDLFASESTIYRTKITGTASQCRKTMQASEARRRTYFRALGPKA